MAEMDNQQHTTHHPKIKPEQILSKIHSAEGNIAAGITSFAGSMLFAYIHIVWFALWIFINHGFFASVITPFDPFPYGLLTMVVSLEAIFLSTFIMVNQNRQALLDTYRDLEDEQEHQEEEQEQEELEKDVEGIEQDVQELGQEFDDFQKDMDDIKKAVMVIQQKITSVEKAHPAPPSSTKKNTP